MADRRKKIGKGEIQKLDYLENEKRFIDEIKSIFYNFFRTIFWWKITHMWRRWGTHQNFWHSLMNLKNKYLSKKLKNCWSGPTKNQNSFNIYNFSFFLKKKKKKRKTPGDIILYLRTKNLDDMIYSSWDIERGRLTLVIFSNVLEISSFYTCTKNHNHMMYGSWDTKWSRHNFLSFWGKFCPLTPIMVPKIKTLKKWKKCLEILSFYTCVP